MELIDLLLDLNNGLIEQDIKFKPVLWEFMDSSMQEGRKEDEYISRLKECEICIVLFWRTLGQYTVEELDVAVLEMQSGRTPKKVLILYKETADVVSPDLLLFREEYSNKYPDIPHLVFSDSKSLRDQVLLFFAAVL